MAKVFPGIFFFFVFFGHLQGLTEAKNRPKAQTLIPPILVKIQIFQRFFKKLFLSTKLLPQQIQTIFGGVRGLKNPSKWALYGS